MRIPKYRKPITPGQVLREDFVEPLGVTQAELADALGVDRTTVNEILNGKRSITPEMAVRLGYTLSTTTQYWLNLQLGVDMYKALHSPIRSDLNKLRILVPSAKRSRKRDLAS
jgi:antitoxin HigA-1